MGHITWLLRGKKLENEIFHVLRNFLNDITIDILSLGPSHQEDTLVWSWFPSSPETSESTTFEVVHFPRTLRSGPRFAACPMIRGARGYSINWSVCSVQYVWSVSFIVVTRSSSPPWPSSPSQRQSPSATLVKRPASSRSSSARPRPRTRRRPPTLRPRPPPTLPRRSATTRPRPRAPTPRRRPLLSTRRWVSLDHICFDDRTFSGKKMHQYLANSISF